mmetsp:Transcript_2287/g.5200  ORF Transcript_2287/g.5200 Transcript_2287/m.5200 type:complete len:229 (+) Transcript_2287:964-1650(+)
MTQRRDATVCFGGEAAQDGLTCMHSEVIHAASRNDRDEIGQILVQTLLIGVDRLLCRANHANPALHSDWHARTPFSHSSTARSDEGRVRHQRCAKAAAAGHAIARAATVEVERIVPPALGEYRRAAEERRVRAANLQHDGVLPGHIVLEEARELTHVAMDERVRRDHLRVQRGVAGELPEEFPEEAVGVVHHRCYSEGAIRERASPRLAEHRERKRSARRSANSIQSP